MRKITTSCILILFSVLHNVISLTICLNKVSLLFGHNLKLVLYSRGASPDRTLAAFQVKKNRTKKVTSTTPWQGDFP